MPSHRPYEFVPVDVPITWRRRLLGGTPLTLFFKIILWVVIIIALFSPWFWVVVAFGVVSLWVGRATQSSRR